jgi:Proteasome/cyclosome repeat
MYRECGGGLPTANRRPEARSILETCLSTIALGLGMIMAGTGDIESFRLLRELRYVV